MNACPPRPLVLVALLAACSSAPPESAVPAEDERARPPRVAIVSGAQAVKTLTTAIYRGGFEAKTCVYETLVKRDDQGRIAPGLASSWAYSDGGRTLRLELRPGARFHDGSAVDARAVRIHLRRWIGLPEHDWLLASRAIRAVEEDGANAVVLRLDPPCDVLPDLCSVNPCGVAAPAALDFEGAFAAPVGSGPWAFDGVREDGRVLRVVRWNERENKRVASRAVDLVRYEQPECRTLVADLLAGRVDAVVESWYVKIPRDLVPALRADPDLRVTEGPGSATTYLSFRLDAGAASDVALRRAIADAVDRDALVAEVERGHADPSRAWAPPGCAGWPASTRPSSPRAPAPSSARVRLLARADTDVNDQRDLARALAAQLERAGIATDVIALAGTAHAEAVRAGGFDARIETTWGMPYDPDLALRARFLDPLPYPTATTPPAHGRDAETARLVLELAAATEPDAQVRARAAVQAHLDAQAIVVPLYVPRRIAAIRAGLGATALDRDLYRVDATLLAAPAQPSSRP